MKYIFLFLFLITTPVIYAQTTFAPIGAVWHFEDIPDLKPAKQNYIRYEAIKDTSYYGHLCSKIVGKKIQIKTGGSAYDTSEQQTQYTYTLGDTVFYYNHNFNRFLVLYNFDVKIGDTVTYHVPFMVPGKPDTTFRITIDSIKLISIDGVMLKRIKASSVSPSLFTIEIMIERIGYIGARSLVDYSRLYGLPYSGGVRCYKDLNIDTNIGYMGFNCEEIDPLDVRNFDISSSITLFPNPVTTTAYLKVPHSIIDPIEVDLIDNFGRHFQIPYTKNKDILEFDLSHLASGMYFLKLSTSNISYQQYNLKIYKN